MVTSIYTKLSGTPCPDKLWAYKSIPIQPLLPCCHRPLSFSHTSQDTIFWVPRFQGAHFKLSESFIKALFTRFADKKVAHSTLPIGECRTARGTVLHDNRKWNGLDSMWMTEGWTEGVIHRKYSTPWNCATWKLWWGEAINTATVIAQVIYSNSSLFSLVYIL